MKKINAVFNLCIFIEMVCLLAIAYFLKDNVAAMYTVLILAVAKSISNIAYMCQLFIRKERTKAELIIVIIDSFMFMVGFVLMLFLKNNLSIYVIAVYCIIAFIFSIVSSIITEIQKQKEEKE